MKRNRGGLPGKTWFCILLALGMISMATGCGKMAEDHPEMERLKMPPEAGFLFGTTKYSVNAQVGGHDPCMIKDEPSGFYYAYSTDNSVDSTKRGKGIQVRRSKDMVNWEYAGVALSEKSILQAQDNGPGNPDTATFWAPCITRKNGEYRMYYAATKAFGSRESRIWLAVSKKPEGPFENRGVAVSSWVDAENYTGPNAIDPELITTPEGKTYLVYGSFFSGVYLKELSPDGLARNTDRKSGDYYGTRIAFKGGSAIDGPEGPSVFYNEKTGYYYLMLSYGWLGDTYDIRVGRSKAVTGPYVDYNGHEMTENTPGLTTGTKIAGSYYFTGTKPGGKQPYVPDDWKWAGFRGPGHGSPFRDGEQFYFIHHIRDGAVCYRTEADGRVSYSMHYLMVRKMQFIDGWPVLSPERYAGETDEPIAARTLTGNWEAISFSSLDNSQETAKTALFQEPDQNGQGTVQWDGSAGTWDFSSGKNSLTVTLPSGAVLHGVVMKCWDLEHNRSAICFTGIDSKGIAWWGKAVSKSTSN